MDNRHPKIKLPGNIFIPADRFYSIVLDSLQDYSIFTTDQNMLINAWLSGASNIFGYQPEEVIGRHYGLIFTKEDQQNNIPEREKETAIREGKATDNRWHVTKDGSLFYAFGLVFPLRDDDDELLGFVKIIRDLTEQKKAEDALKKQMKELEELNTHKENILAILSHDLRSPLGSIIEISDYLKSNMDELDPADIKQMLGILHQSTSDELNMLDYLLEWARVKYASEAFSPSTIDLGKIVDKVLDTFSDQAASNSISLYNEVKEATPVFADKKMVLSILQNLLSNAIKYTPSGGSIIVSASANEDEVTVKVKDTGIGIPDDKLQKLFKPQIKPLSQLRKEDKGAGIGLLLVKGFVERNGGTICAESIEGEGTTFYFTLPANQQSGKKVNADNLSFNKGR